MSQSFHTFYLGNYHFALPSDKVSAVDDSYPITKLLLAPPAIRGLLNINGQVVTAIDLHKTLQIKPNSDDEVQIISQCNKQPLSLIVERMGESIEIEASQRQAIPNQLDSEIKELLEGMVQLDNELLLLLNVDKLN